MEAICLSGKGPEVIGSILQQFLKPEIKTLFFGEKVADREVASLFYLPTTVIYGLYRESEANPIGVIFFCNIGPGENGFVYMFFFNQAAREKGITIDVCNFIKKDLLNKCPSLNSIETIVVNGDPELEKTLVEMGFEKIGTKKRFKKFGDSYIDITIYYYLLNEG